MLQMVYAVLYSPNFTLISSPSASFWNNYRVLVTSHKLLEHGSTLLSCNTKKRRESHVLSVASSSSAVPYQPINVHHLEREFSGHGVTFEDIGDNCIAKLALDNGSSATLMLPSGLITSYKVPVWHGGTVELLHTLVSEGEDGDAVIEGGVSLAFGSGTYGESSWPASNWILQDIRGDSEESIQVELISSDKDNMVEMKCTLVLTEETLSSELLVSNLNNSPLQLKGSIISHLTVSTPDATYAVGLEGSNFIETKPFLSRFGIIPDQEKEKKPGFGLLYSGEIAPKGDFPGPGGNSSRENEEVVECEENDNYKQLNNEMSRIYRHAPQYFTVIDRGRRNSLVVGREGFEEMYMFSPGSRHECYSKFSYICIGQSALLKPIILKPGYIWRGVQHLHNPNL